MEVEGSISQSSVIMKPGVGSSYGNGWRRLWKYFLELFLILIISLILTIPTNLGSWGGLR